MTRRMTWLILACAVAGLVAASTLRAQGQPAVMSARLQIRQMCLPLVLNAPPAPTPTRTPIVTATRTRTPTPTRTTTPACDPYEPNDDRYTNPWGPLTSGQAIQAKFCTGDRYDNYFFDLAASGTTQVRLQLPVSLVNHTVLWLYASTDLDNPLDGKAPVDSADYTLSRALQAGRYIVRLYTDGVADDANPYTLTYLAPATPTPTRTPTKTNTPTRTPTKTATPTRTLTATPSATPTITLTPSPTPIPQPTDPLLLRLAPGVEMRLVRVPAGSFTMGSADSDHAAFEEEKPQHMVYLDEYLIGKYEVTVAQWRAFVNATAYAADSRSLADPDNRPVRWVSWEDATAFCAWASLATGRNVRLPTEAQWEKAARGTDARKYPWGNDAPTCSLCNHYRCVGDTSAVGSYSPQGDSPYSCADMAGNVWEQVRDWYAADYYSWSPGSNPAGPATGSCHVVRGGSCNSDTTIVRAAVRGWYHLDPIERLFNVGFRVCVSPI